MKSHGAARPAGAPPLAPTRGPQHGRCRPTSRFVFLRADLVAVEPMPRDHFRIAMSLLAATLEAPALGGDREARAGAA
jgi:hypothetical protein